MSRKPPPHDRGMLIRDNWINGNRSDAIKAAGRDTAGALCAYGALYVFDGRSEAEQFATAVIRQDPSYRG